MYSAESVIAALKSNDKLACEGIDNVYCPLSHPDCPGDPDNCGLCLNQKCEQTISVHRDYTMLVRLHFYFMVSKENHGGFIHKGDSELLRLIKHKYIDIADLKSVGLGGKHEKGFNALLFIFCFAMCF